jgi:hypothetical protein
VFRSALPVGVLGLSEEVSAEVTRRLLDPARLLEQLRCACPDGIEFSSARSVEIEEHRRISRGPSAMRWFIALEPGGDVERAVGAVLGAAELVRERRTGRRLVEVDLRPLIAAAHVERAGDRPFLERCGLDADGAVAVFEARPRDGRWIRGSEIASLLAEHGVVASLLVRELSTRERCP